MILGTDLVDEVFFAKRKLVEFLLFYGLVSNESFDTEKALSAGYRFSNLRDWIFELIDTLIEAENRS